MGFSYPSITPLLHLSISGLTEEILRRYLSVAEGEKLRPAMVDEPTYQNKAQCVCWAPQLKGLRQVKKK
jgi:hypothetical protein